MNYKLSVVLRVDCGLKHGETLAWSFEVIVAVLLKAVVVVSLSDAMQFSAAARQQLTAGQPETQDQDYLYVYEVVISAAVSLLILYIVRAAAVGDCVTDYRKGHTQRRITLITVNTERAC